MIGGIIFGLYYTTIVSVIFNLKKRRNPSTNSTTREQEKVKEELENELKIKPDLIKKNSELIEDELKIYQFEKDLATHAIEKILLASKNKAIDSFEKDRLLLKYKDQLKNLNGKMEKIQSEIDVTRLINLRNDLAFLLDNKISDIDEKIKDINLKIGTNYNIKDILNHTIKDKSRDESLKNINNPSFIDIEGKGGRDDDNLNFRELTTYKNNSKQKRKEMVIESERKKIDELKDQVLVALNRLDKTGDLKMELKDDLDTSIVTATKTTFMDKDFQDIDQKKEETNENKEYVNIENNEKPFNRVSENKLNFPTIFSWLGKSKTDIVTTKMTLDPLSKSTAGNFKNYVNSNSNTINESNSFTYFDTEKNTYNDNKKTPLSNILNQVSPNFDHSMMKFKHDNKYLSEDQSHKDKPLPVDHNANNNTHNNNRFKFPLAFIFSKKRKEKEEEEEEEGNKKEKRWLLRAREKKLMS